MFGQLIQQLQEAGNVQYHKYHRTCPVCKTTFGTNTRLQIYCCKECNFKSKERWKTKRIIDEVCDLVRNTAMTRSDIAKALGCGMRSAEEKISDHRELFYIANYTRVRSQFVPMFKLRTRKEKDMSLDEYKRRNGIDYTTRVCVSLTKEQLAKINAKRGSMQKSEYLRKLLDAA